MKEQTSEYEKDQLCQSAFAEFLWKKVMEPAVKYAEMSVGKTDSELRREMAILQMKAAFEASHALTSLSKNGLDLQAVRRVKSNDERVIYFRRHMKQAAGYKRQLRELTRSLHARVYLKTADFFYRWHTIFKGKNKASELVEQLYVRYPD